MKGFKRGEKKNPERKTSTKSAPTQEERPSAIRTNNAYLAGRVLLWTLIAFLLVKGIFSILSPSSEARVRQLVVDYERAGKARMEQQIGAAAFAEGFASEYYTFSGKTNSGYGSRLQVYLAKGLEVKEPSSGLVQAEVLSAKAQDIAYLSDWEMDVDVHLKVEYTDLQGEENTVSRKDVYLRVPLTTDGKDYAVVSQPSHIPERKRTDIKAVTLSGQSVPQSEAQEIRATMSSFFSVYFGGTDNEVSYYLTADSNVSRGVSSGIDFQKIDAASVYVVEDDVYQADVSLSVMDMGQSMNQRFFLELVKQGDKFYVKSLNARPVTY